LHAAIRVMHEAAAKGTTFAQGLLERVEHEARMHRARGAPADDPSRECVDDEGDVDEAGPSGEWSKKRFRASPPRTVRAPFSAYGSPFNLGPWP